MTHFQIDVLAIAVGTVVGTSAEAVVGLSFWFSLMICLLAIGCVLYFLGEQPKVTVPPLRRKHRRYIGWFE